LDYLTKVENLYFREAVEVVSGIAPAIAPPQREEPSKTILGITILIFLNLSLGKSPIPCVDVLLA